jgi:hypothetical protein
MENRFIEHSQVVTTNNCNSLTGLHTLKITVTIAHKIKSSMCACSSLLGNGSYLVNISQLNAQLLHCLLESFTNESWLLLATPLQDSFVSSTDWISKSKSKLLYDWQFTANQFVLASTTLSLSTRDLFQLNPCGNSPYVTSSLARRWVDWICSAGSLI